jgi:hypothetical protein
MCTKLFISQGSYVIDYPRVYVHDSNLLSSGTSTQRIFILNKHYLFFLIEWNPQSDVLLTSQMIMPPPKNRQLSQLL